MESPSERLIELTRRLKAATDAGQLEWAAVEDTAFLWTASHGAVGVRSRDGDGEEPYELDVFGAERQKVETLTSEWTRTSSPPPGTRRWRVSTALRDVRRSASTGFSRTSSASFRGSRRKPPRRPSARGAPTQARSRARSAVGTTRLRIPSGATLLGRGRRRGSREPRTPRPGRLRPASGIVVSARRSSRALEARTRPRRSRRPPHLAIRRSSTSPSSRSARGRRPAAIARRQAAARRDGFGFSCVCVSEPLWEA